MALTPIWPASIDAQGRLVVNAGEEYEAFLAGMKGYHLEVLIRRYRKDRTIDQMGYYWGCVIHLISEHLGHEPEEVHVMLKNKFILPKTSITKLDREAFATFIDDCIRFAAVELGVIIPEPQRVSWQ